MPSKGKLTRDNLEDLKRSSSEIINCECGFYKAHFNCRDKNEKSQSSTCDSSVEGRTINWKPYRSNRNRRRSTVSRGSSVESRGSSVANSGTFQNLSRSGKFYQRDNSVASSGASRNLNRSGRSSRKDNLSPAIENYYFTRLPQHYRSGTQQNSQRSQSESSTASTRKISPYSRMESKRWSTVKRELKKRAKLRESQSKSRSKKSKKSQRELKEGLTKHEFKSSQRVPFGQDVNELSNQNHPERSQNQLSRRSERSQSELSQDCSFERNKSELSRHSERSQSGLTQSHMRGSLSKIRYPGLRSAQASTRSQSSSTHDGKRSLLELPSKLRHLPSSSRSQSKSGSTKKVQHLSRNGSVCKDCRLKALKSKNQRERAPSESEQKSLAYNENDLPSLRSNSPLLAKKSKACLEKTQRRVFTSGFN